MNTFPLYTASIGENGDGMLSVSFVASPAIGCGFKITEDRGDELIIEAPVLLANKPIYRNNDAYGEHYVLFTKQGISGILENYAKLDLSARFSIEHSEDIEDVNFVETYQVDYGKRIMPYPSIYGVTDGSWVSKISIRNASLIDKVRSGDVTGLSISGVFTYERVSLEDAIEIYNLIR